MFKEKTTIKDNATVTIERKSPEEIEKIKRGDPAIAELKRRRRQTPDKWYAIASNADEVFDAIWPNLFPNNWIRIVYKNGNVITGKIKDFPKGNLICLDMNTMLCNSGICNIELLEIVSEAISQVFLNNEQLTNKIRSLRG